MKIEKNNYLVNILFIIIKKKNKFRDLKNLKGTRVSDISYVNLLQ